MRKTTKVTGTKIAQAAKDLNVTSVTIRRYISEFGIETTTDENGIKVLPDAAMTELQEVRRLKEDGNTNPQVLEFLEESRAKGGSDVKAEAKPEKEKPRASRITKSPGKTKEKEVAPAADDDDEDEVEAEEEEAPQARSRKRAPAKKVREEAEEPETAEESERDEEETGEAGEGSSEEGDAGDGRLKHALTCQTCGKSFEHMNPRLRDCLDCYRAKRKERRRGGDRHKNVIQHPLAQQVASKMANQQQQQQEESEGRPERPERVERADRAERPDRPGRSDRAERPERVERVSPTARPPRRDREQIQSSTQNVGVTQPIIGGLKTQVRSYRKAIEETRAITGSLKRRLERPDLPEGDRRWLEQIYAYQLILHQGWRHLSEYRSTTAAQKKTSRTELVH